MKKFYIEANSAGERSAVFFDFDGLEADYIMECGGDPCTSEDCAATLGELLESAATEIIEASPEDYDYIREWCRIWGMGIIATYAEAIKAGYILADCKYQRGYISRRADISKQPVRIAGGSRKGQLYVLLPAWESSRYCIRQYLAIA